MPRYREWDRDPEEYRPCPTREKTHQRRRWDDEDYSDKQEDQDDDFDDRDNYRS